MVIEKMAKRINAKRKDRLRNSSNAIDKNLIKDAIREVLNEQATVDNLESIYRSAANNHDEILKDDSLMDKIRKLDRKQALKIIGWYGLLFSVILLSIIVFAILSMLLGYIPEFNKIKNIFAFVALTILSFLTLCLCTWISIWLYSKVERIERKYFHHTKITRTVGIISLAIAFSICNQKSNFDVFEKILPFLI